MNIPTDTNSPQLQLSQQAKQPEADSLRHIPRPRIHSKALEILSSWYRRHKDNPYPSRREKYELSLKCELSYQTVDNWFMNVRGKYRRKYNQPPQYIRNPRDNYFEATNIVKDENCFSEITPNTPVT